MSDTYEINDSGSDQHLVRRCVTHHFACDCREAFMAESMQTQRRVIDWHSQSDEGLRLRCGELSAQEIRTIRAVLAAILPPNVKEHATLSAGASVDHGVEVETKGEHENRAADRGCCVSTCSASWIQGQLLP